jgi:hypothetical protein
MPDGEFIFGGRSLPIYHMYIILNYILPKSWNKITDFTNPKKQNTHNGNN